MALTVTTIAQKTRLTTAARVQAELFGGTATDTTLIEAEIDRATAAILAYCHRPFTREAYTETLGAFNDIHLQLARTPIVGTPSSVSWNTSVLTDWSVADREKGWLYRRLGWSWTAQVRGGLIGTGAWLDQGWPLPRQEEPQFSVDYVAGYLLPDDNVTATTISAAAADNSFNDSAAGFPALLKAGDVITVSGFTGAGAAAANKRHVVTGTPTTSKVQVTSTLVDDAAGETVTITFQTLPYDVEKACIETTKAYYLQRYDDPNIEEKQVAVMRLRFGARGGQTIFSDPQGLPPNVVGLLRPWVRAA